jgi:hypothetical protein
VAQLDLNAPQLFGQGAKKAAGAAVEKKKAGSFFSTK